MAGILLDILFAARALRRTPAFTVAAAATLALGICGCTAIFTVAGAALFRTLPYPDPGRIVLIETMDRTGRGGAQPADFLDWKSRNHVFEEVAATIDYGSYKLTDRDRPAEVSGLPVSASMFRLLRVRPALGRTFLDSEDQPGAPPVALISESLWESRYQRDPLILRRTLEIEGLPVTVVGVLPRSFALNETRGVRRAEIWVPIAQEFGARKLAVRDHTYQLRIWARLRPQISLPQAQAEMDLIARQLERQYPATNTGRRVRLSRMADVLAARVSSQARVLIGVLGAAVGCVLLIACANVANLLMARAVGRQREIALRAALGAGRLRILRQLLIESLLLAVSGGAAGLALAVWSLQALLAIAPANLPIPRLDQLRIDGTVIGFVIALSFLTAALFGIVPGWNAARSDINSVLKQGGVASSPSRQWFRGTLIAAETALSVVLLTAAGQLISTWVSLLNVSPGIRTAGVFAFSLPAPDREMAAHERQSFYEAQLQRTSDIPGVRGVALADRMPFTGAEWLQNFQARTPMRAVARRVSPGYFDALGIAVRAGRVFSERDTASSPKVVMINETAARRYWPDGNALGQIIRQTGEHDRTLGPSETATIIGIVADSRQRLDSPPLPQILFSYSQVGGYRDVVLILRSQVRAGDVAAAVRATARRLDRGQPVGDPAPLDRERIESIAPQRFQTMLVSGFAAVALLLACAGIYGVVAFTVGQQTREIGIRMALGATGHRTVRYVVGRNGRWIVAGMLLGAFGSLGTNRILRAQFPGTAALDWLIIATAASCLCASALTAMGLPARRAAGVDPALALRQ